MGKNGGMIGSDDRVIMYQTEESETMKETGQTEVAECEQQRSDDGPKCCVRTEKRGKQANPTDLLGCQAIATNSADTAEMRHVKRIAG